MPAIREHAMEEAIAWRIRLAEAGGDDWSRFALWLEQDPANAVAYDDLTVADGDACESLTARWHVRPLRAPPPQTTTPRGQTRRIVGGLALAAALVASIGVPALLRNGQTGYTVVTGPGEHRTIRFADGTRIDLDGGTRLGLDRANRRVARLDAGEALFSVRHDAVAPFEVAIGDSRIRDVGTVFDVSRTGGATEVAVAEGAVLYNPRSEAVALSAGDRLVDPDGPLPIRRSRIDRSTVASWRHGRLVFREAPLIEVADAIGRTTGATILVDPAIAARPFTGVVMVDRDQDRVFRKLGPLLDVKTSRDANGWRLEPSASPGP